VIFKLSTAHFQVKRTLPIVGNKNNYGIAKMKCGLPLYFGFKGICIQDNVCHPAFNPTFALKIAC